MVSKNNTQLLAKRLTEREVPHYSLRKLGIGVVSVLLGTTMYLGANNTVANADEVTNASDAGTDTTQTGGQITNAGKTAVIGNHNSASSIVSSSQDSSVTSQGVASAPTAVNSSANVDQSAVEAVQKNIVNNEAQGTENNSWIIE